MANFVYCYENTMKAEGDYSNNPTDRGGETWKGIARRRWPQWAGWKLVDEIRENTRGSFRKFVHALRCDDELETSVRGFYKLMYWEPLKLEEFDDETASEIFDTAVNQGSTAAVSYLQQALNLLNNNQRHYSDIAVDGKMGPVTLAAYKAFMLTAKTIEGRTEAQNIKILVKGLNGFQFETYRKIAQSDPEQEVFFYGWLQRT